MKSTLFNFPKVSYGVGLCVLEQSYYIGQRYIISMVRDWGLQPNVELIKILSKGLAFNEDHDQFA